MIMRRALRRSKATTNANRQDWSRGKSWRRLLLAPLAVISCLTSIPCLFSGQAVGSCLAAAPPLDHVSTLDESVDFYQYTDKDGVIHFIDTPEKIPPRYRSRVIVRKDLPAGQQVTRIAVVDRQIHLPVTLKTGSKAVTAVMLLDTGASLTCITADLAARLRIDAESSRASTTTLADGSEIAIRLATIDSLGIGTKVKSPFEVGIIQRIDSPELHDGFLGLDFLGDFQYQIDIPNNIIHWQ